MIVTASAAVVAITVGLAFELGLEAQVLQAHFSAGLSPQLHDAFGLSILVMAAHKWESWKAREQDHCPVYLTALRAPWAQTRRDLNFVVFVGTFLMMMGVVWLAMRGGYWGALLLGVWMAQGLHELHHTAKAAAQRSYYPGAWSSVVFVGMTDFLLWPLWSSSLSLPPELSMAFYLLQPVLWFTYALEHRQWLVRVAEVGGLEHLRAFDPVAKAHTSPEDVGHRHGRGSGNLDVPGSRGGLPC